MNQGYFYAIISSLLLSGSLILNKYMLTFLNPQMLSFIFFLAVFVVSSVFIVYKGHRDLVSNIVNHWKDGLVVGGFNAMAASFFFIALSLLDASTTSFLVRFSTVFIILIGVFFLKEKLAFIDIIGIFLAVGGAFVINYSNGSFTRLGLLVAMAAAFGIALHQVTAKLFVRRLHPLHLVNIRTLFTAAILFVVALLTSHIQPVPLSLLPYFAAGGVVAGIGFIFFYRSLENMEVSKAAIIRTLDPFIVVLYSFVLFRTLPGAKEILGGSLIVAGVMLITMRHRLGIFAALVRKLRFFE